MLLPESIATHLYTQPMHYPMPTPTPTPAVPNPRKRPAPGSIPMPMPPQQYFSPNPSDQVPSWNGDSTGNFMGNSMNNMNMYGMMSPAQGQNAVPYRQESVPPSSTALARRGVNNQLVAANRSYNIQQNDPWATYDDALLPGQNAANIEEHDSIEALEERAQRAKRDAQAKRKQIPPFVQKLNSFLEDGKNTDLIRWSEKGDSFIVLDEDEFAKTLIPELFKHNNYASFVRQLNMYGFHKKVGLSDNSMKASERKNKSPSEYYNPYFRRGHPNLLWLINKPKSNNSKKKKPLENGEVDSEEDVIVDEGLGQTINQQSTARNLALPAPEAGPLQKKEMVMLRDQVKQLQDSQRQIRLAIDRLAHDHSQLQAQAMAFQEKHDRHENSINAILNFLANVFRKSLEEQGGVQNAGDILASFIPNMQMPPQVQQGSVVDLGDWVQQQSRTATPLTAPPKRQQRFLPPIPPQHGQVETLNSPSNSAAPGAYDTRQPQMGSVTELLDSPADTTSASASATTPSYLKHELDSNPQEGMLKIIQDANSSVGANTSPTPLSIDLPNMVANTSSNMTNDQRNRMLSLLSASSGGAASTPVTTSVGSAPPAISTHTAAMPASTTQTSIAPVSNAGIPPAHIQQMSQTQEEIDQLQRLQQEQAKKLDNLSHFLGPYSPSGKIPGLEDATGYFDGDFDLNQYLDSNAFNVDGTGADLDFGNTNFDNANFNAFNSDGLKNDPGVGTNGGAGRVVEAETPSHKSPSPSGTEEIPQDGFDNSPGRSAKRQRKT